jgi:hypothetical protein
LVFTFYNGEGHQTRTRRRTRQRSSTWRTSSEKRPENYSSAFFDLANIIRKETGKSEKETGEFFALAAMNMSNIKKVFIPNEGKSMTF